jgi:lysophospholipase L1-like esterase
LSLIGEHSLCLQLKSIDFFGAVKLFVSKKMEKDEENRKRRKKVVILGSSVAEGEHCYVSWASRLSSSLGEGFLVRNLAMSGFATRNLGNLITKAEKDDQVGAIDYIMLSLSIPNEKGDFLGFKERIKAGVEQLTQRFPHARLILCGPYPVNLPLFARQYPALIDWMKTLPVYYFVDFFTSIATEDGSWERGKYQDMVHPNDAGHEQMFGCIDLDKFK